MTDIKEVSRWILHSGIPVHVTAQVDVNLRAGRLSRHTGVWWVKCNTGHNVNILDTITSINIHKE